MSLKNKIIISAIFLFSFMILLFSTTLFFFYKKHVIKNRLNSAESLVEVYEEDIIYAGVIENRDILENISEKLKKINFVDFIIIKKNNREIFKKIIKDSNSLIVITDAHTINTFDKASTITITLGANIDDFKAHFRQSIFALTSFIFFITFIFFLILSAILSKYFNTIENIAEGMKLVPGGNYNKVTVAPYKELEPVIEAYNSMIVLLQEKDDKIRLQINDILEKKQQLKNQLAEIKALQEMLIMKEKLAGLGTIVAGIAHEINNPIAAIRGLCELHQLKSKDNSDKKLFGKIITYCDRIADIVKSLKVYGKSIKVTDKEIVSLSEIISDAIEMEKHAKILNNVKIKGNFREFKGKVFCKKSEILQVFINLINNSVMAMNKKGVINIDIFDRDNIIEVHFKDSGPGIPEDIKNKIFEPFFTTKREKGTGLGLYIIYKILEQHNATIKLEDSEQGAYFVIKFEKGQGKNEKSINS